MLLVWPPPALPGGVFYAIDNHLRHNELYGDFLVLFLELTLRIIYTYW
jgi:hypothetical protein